MTTWSKDELRKIAEADDLHISPFREDGVTHGTPTWIWSVAVDSALYVRAYNGQSSCWYRAAMRQKAGRIIAAGITKEVTFEPVDGPITNRIGDAYRTKYRGSPHLDPMIGARARSATVKVMPRDTNARSPTRTALWEALRARRHSHAVRAKFAGTSPRTSQRKSEVVSACWGAAPHL